MPLIVWDQSLSVGVEVFDGHHKKLVDLINTLNDAMGQGKGRDVVGATLDELVRYTQYHFSEEEKLMAAKAYPSLAAHKAEHKALTQKALDLAAQHKAGHIAITVPVLHFLRDWLTNHIKGTDKKYGPYLSPNGGV
ncbi:MAG: hemerythrin family protein [Elusimicrobia bacterium]|nr:hemerythrin family protein [Elusimicrobiota bacterium]